MSDFIKIPYMLFRGGTSKGPCFDWKYFSENQKERDELLLRIMGSPHKIQVDGIGGCHDLANKVCLIKVSNKSGIDVEYLLCQIHANSSVVETDIDCGNMLAAVAAFAIEMKFVKVTKNETSLKIWSHNSNTMIEALLPTPNAEVNYFGNETIDGVAGTSSAIHLSFLDPVGSSLGKEFPTGNPIDLIDGIPVSCVDISMPMVIVPAVYFNKTGNETKEELDLDKQFMMHAESIRKKAAQAMGLGDVTGKTSPKICLISEPKSNGNICARYLIAPFDFNCHPSFAVTGAMCLGGAIFLNGTVCEKYFNINKKNFEKEKINSINIEHPSGSINVTVYLNNQTSKIEKISYIRTARPLSSGYVFVSPQNEKII